MIAEFDIPIRAAIARTQEYLVTRGDAGKQLPNVFSIDVTGAVHDCEQSPDEPACRQLGFIESNCAIIDKHNVLCDLRLLWRLYRYAHLANLSTVVDPKTHRSYLGHSVETMFLLADLHATGDLRSIQADVAAIQRFYSGSLSDLGQRQARIFSAMLDFILFHEFGHAIHGDLNAGAMAPCTSIMHDDTRSQCTRRADLRETSADDFATLAFASLDIDEVGAVAELFHFEMERLRLKTRLELSIDLAWEIDGNTPKTHRYLERLHLNLDTSSHPTFLARYMRILSLLADRGVQLKRSLSLLMAYGLEAHAAHAICPEDEVLFSP